MKKMKIVTQKRLQRAVDTVIRELVGHGLWTSELAEVEVYLVPFGDAFGWQLNRDGNIYIPALSLCRLGYWIRGKYMSLVDIVRHEYAHAYGHYHANRVDVPSFYSAFGTTRDDDDYGREFHEDVFVTPYAATRPEEDWAEVWMFFVKHKGVIPKRLADKPVIRRKWNFIHNLCRRNRRKEGY